MNQNMRMHTSPNCGSREIGAGLEEGGEGVVGREKEEGAHVGVEEDGVRREVGFGGGADEGGEEEGVRVGDGREEEEGMVRGFGGDEEGEEFGEEGEGVVEVGDDEVGMDLLEGPEAGAGAEEGLVDGGVRRMVGHWRLAMDLMGRSGGSKIGFKS